MNRWIERILFRLFGWWRWKRRLRGIDRFALNAVCDERVRVLVSEPNAWGQHEIQMERRDGQETWNLVATVRQEEFPQMVELLTEAYNLIHPAARRWKVVPQ